MVAAYRFPVIDFSSLGDLPQVYEEASMRAGRKNALAGLDSSNSASLERTGAALLRAGDIDGATKLFNIVQQRNSLAQRGSNDEFYNKTILPLIMERMKGGGGGAPATAPTPSYSPPTQDEPAPAPGGLKPWPVSQAEPPLAAVGAAPLEPPAMRVDEAQISPVLAPKPSPGPEPQVAQAGPMVQSPLVPQASPAKPAPVPGQPPVGFDPRLSVIPGTLPEAPVQRPVPKRLPMPGQNPEDVAAADKAYNEALLFSVSKGAPAGLGAAARERYSAALKKLNVPAEEQQYLTDQLQRQQLGLPQVTLTDWQKGKQGYGPLLEELIKTDADIQKRGNKSTDVLQSLEVLDQISKHPDFQSGEGTGLVNRFRSGLYTAREAARSLGVPEDLLPRLEDIKGAKSTQLGEMFQAVSNRLIFDALGGLGAQVSNSDRTFSAASFPNLALTPQGNKLLIQYLKAQYAQDKAAAAVARTYRKQYGVNADAPGLLDAVQKYRDEHSILVDSKGEKTALGKEIDQAIGGNKSVSDVVSETYGPGSPASQRVQRAVEPIIEKGKEVGADLAARAAQELPAARQQPPGFIQHFIDEAQKRRLFNERPRFLNPGQ